MQIKRALCNSASSESERVNLSQFFKKILLLVTSIRQIYNNFTYLSAKKLIFDANGMVEISIFLKKIEIQAF